MKSFIAALRNLVLPWGRTTGPRIVLNGDTGEIDIYDASNALVIRITANPSQIAVGPDTGVQAVLTSTGGVGQIEFPTHQPQEEIDARIAAAAVNDGAANETLVLGINGPQSTLDHLRYRQTFNTTAADSSAEGGITFNRMVGAVDTVVGGFRRVIGEACDRFFVNGRILIQPLVDNSNTALLLDIPATYAGNWLRVRKNGVDRLVHTTSGILQLRRTNSADDIFAVFLDADSTARMNMDAGGAMGWGPGTGGTDVSLDRSASGVLRVGGDLIITGNDTAGVEDFTNRTVTSVGYATGTELSATIVCPASGVVEVSTSVRGQNSTASGRIFQAVRIDDLTTSAVLQAVVDDRAAVVPCSVANEQGSSCVTFRVDIGALGATPGDSIKFLVQNRVTSGTATILSRLMCVKALTS